MSDGPVFIGGLADSGKTPLGRTLTARTSIVITRHTQLWRRFAGSFGDLRQNGNLERFLETLLSDPAVLRLQVDVERFRASLSDLEPTVSAVLARLHAQHAEQLGKRRWGEQCGALETYAPHMLEDLPTAKVIHLVRDPVVAYRLAARRAGNRPGRLGRFTARWTASAALARTHAERFRDRFLIVRYESLASRPDTTFRAICAFLEEPVSDAALPVGDWRPAATGSGLLTDDDKYGPEAETIGGRTGHAEARFLAMHAGGQLHQLGYGPRPSGIGRPGPTYLAHWPANRLALAITRGRTSMALPSRVGG